MMTMIILFPVIFLIIPDDSLRDYLLAAHDEGMTSGDFQFLFARQRLASQSYIDVLKSEAMWKRNDARDDDARQAYRNLLYVRHNMATSLSLFSSLVCLPLFLSLPLSSALNL